MITRPTDQRPGTPWRGIALICVVVGAYHVWNLPRAWAAWRGGVADDYPGEHRRLLLGHVTGLALALAIPVPSVMGMAWSWTRNQRVALWITWGVLMAIVLGSLALNFLT